MRLTAEIIRRAEPSVEEVKIEFRCRQDGSLPRILDMFKGEKKGILAFDPTGDFKGGRVPAVQVVPNLDLAYDFQEGNKNDKDTKSWIILRVQPKGEFDSEEDVKKRLERYKGLIIGVLQNLGEIGNTGHSFEIVFYPDNPQAKIEKFGWDGDGSDYINLDDLKDEIKALEALCA